MNSLINSFRRLGRRGFLRIMIFDKHLIERVTGECAIPICISVVMAPRAKREMDGLGKARMVSQFPPRDRAGWARMPESSHFKEGT